MDRTTERLTKYVDAMDRRQLRRLARNMTGNPEIDVVNAAEVLSMDDPEAYVAWRLADGGLISGGKSVEFSGEVNLPGGEKQYFDPTVTDVHVDGVLTGMSVMYRNDSYIADQVAPVIPVVKESDTFFTYDTGDFLRDEAEVRAHGGPTAQAGYTLSRSPAAISVAPSTRSPRPRLVAACGAA